MDTPDPRGRLVRRLGNEATQGLAIATLYCVAYVAAWLNSLDQWFLPVGLRTAVLLLIPRRWLWAWLLGDIAALLLMRVPRAAFDGLIWSYTSPLLVGALYAVVPLAARRVLRTPAAIVAWFPLVAVTGGAWSWASNWLINLYMAGPNPFSGAAFALNWWLGSCLGIMVVTLPALLWATREHKHGWYDSRLTRDSTVCALVVLALSYAVTMSMDMEPAIRIGLLMLTITPAVVMTFGHGWRGAAVGCLAANLGVGLTLPDFQQEGAIDGITLVAQQGLVVAMVALLALGSAITRHRQRADTASRAEEAAITLLDNNQRITEQTLRDHLLLLARMQSHVDRGRQQLVEWLRTHSHYSAALDLNSLGVEHRAAFDAYATALYPIRVEQDGLPAVVMSEAFTRFWVGDTPVRCQFRGHVSALPLALQLWGYRTICSCFVILCDLKPSAYEVQIRVMQSRGTHWLVIRMVADGAQGAAAHGSAAAREDLEQRARAHGGAAKVRHHAHRIIAAMPERRINGRKTPPTIPLRPLSRNA